VAVVASLPEAMPEARALALAAAGIVPLFGIEEALSAIETAALAGELRSRPWSPIKLLLAAPNGDVRSLTEWEGKQALSRAGLAIPPGRLVADAGEAAQVAAKLGFPAVVKAVGREIAHKSEIGAVRLDLRDESAVHAAAGAVGRIGEAILVERAVTDAVAELIIGVVRDPRLGLHLVVGSGGVLVELMADRRVLLMPASREAIQEALLGLKAAPLLRGYRGKSSADIDAAVAAVMAVQDYALEHAARLVELDVNPLMLRPQGQGAVAVDVLIRMTGEESHG
jgi:acyl-CoA synthetase (NDP forming)